MANSYGSKAASKGVRSFIFGKGFSAVSTFIALSLLVKILVPADFGLYVSFFATVEILYLISGFGLSTFAQKYVTEFAASKQYDLLKKSTRIALALRFLIAVLFSFVFYLCFKPLAEFFEMTQLSASAWLLAVLLVFEIMMRYFSELFPAMMWQGRSQVIFLIRSIVRMSLYGFFAFFNAKNVSLFDVFLVDLLATIAASMYAYCVLHINFKNMQTDSRQNAINNPMREVLSICFQFYTVQVIGQTYGNNILKLLVLKFFGAVQSAHYGFAQSISDMLRNYLPGFLLLGVVRPIFIARYQEKKDPSVLDEMFNFILKINIFSLLPIAAMSFYVAEPILHFLSHGKFVGLGYLFLIMIFVLMLQCIHQVLGLINLSTGSPRISIVATIMASLGVVCGLLMIPYFGVYGVASGAFISEFFWCAICILFLRKSGVHLNIDAKNFFLLIASAMLAVLISYPIPLWLSGPLGLWLAGLNAMALYFIFSAMIRPFSLKEKEWICKALPKRMNRFFIW
ncbi:lipopolysaccharide biosynthesis protein [Deefgea rivuli]|uniref:lipopolysaccharide biosynthesis protein n=1 Tax=Deefgea rivuli TaxID=400948 RepID=UPI000484F75B|nr:polysaccharide biosynthesis C-terminal domain-containing protein [Deefgea rivuli]